VGCRWRSLRDSLRATFIVGVLLGDLAQPGAFSPADDDISDLGAQTADQAWLYNQIAANLNGLLIVAFALGLWRGGCGVPECAGMSLDGYRPRPRRKPTQVGWRSACAPVTVSERSTACSTLRAPPSVHAASNASFPSASLAWTIVASSSSLSPGLTIAPMRS
jgi:hypothetical protein